MLPVHKSERTGSRRRRSLDSRHDFGRTLLAVKCKTFMFGFGAVAILCCVLYAFSNLRIVGPMRSVFALYAVLQFASVFLALSGILLALCCGNQCFHGCSAVFQGVYAVMAVIVLVAWIRKIVAVLVENNKGCVDEEHSDGLDLHQSDTSRDLSVHIGVLGVYIGFNVWCYCIARHIRGYDQRELIPDDSAL